MKFERKAHRERQNKALKQFCKHFDLTYGSHEEYAHIDAVLYNFYAMSALAVTFIAVWFNIDIGPMKNAKYTFTNRVTKPLNGESMYYMLLPIILMVLLVFVYLYITGDGNILKGSGSSAIFYTVLTTLIFTLFYYVKWFNK